MANTHTPKPFGQGPEQSPDAGVSAAIRSHLAYRRLTQADLAQVLGISQTQVSARMRGEVRWTVNDLYLVAAWLDIAPSSLLQAAA